MQEITLLVLFDISQNKLRNKIIEKCKDYGLTRIQKSCFSGSLPVSMKADFIKEIRKVIGRQAAQVVIQPICAKCHKNAFIIDNSS